MADAVMMKQSNFRKHFTYSLLFHLVILSILIVSFEFSGKMPVLENSNKNSEIVNAVVINDTKIESAKPTLASPPKQQKPPKKVAPPEKPKAEPIKQPEPPKQQIKKPVEPQVNKEAIAISEQRKKLFQQQLIEKQLLADMKKQKQKDKKLKQKALEEAFAKELKATAAKSLEQQLLKESNQLANASAQKMQGIVNKYQALILQAISQNWIVPYNVDKSLTTELMIRVAAGGQVLDVQIVRSSGDAALDRSARAAVFKASPLPVPTKKDEFEPFRQFALKVKPEIVASTSAI